MALLHDPTPRERQHILISVDDHVIEPPDMFEGRVAAKYADRAPRVEHTASGNDVWVFNGAHIPNIGLNAVAGRPKEEYGVNPTAFDEMRAGCFDVNERVKDMSAGGVLACMCFPSFPSFSGRLFLGCADKDLALAVVQAYNDWHIDEWCGTHPGRFIPMALPVSGAAPAYPTHGSASTPTLPFPSAPATSSAPGAPVPTDPNAPTKSLADVEMEYILQVYAKNGMNKQKTSDELGISLKTLYNKLHKYEEERQRRAG